MGCANGKHHEKTGGGKLQIYRQKNNSDLKIVFLGDAGVGKSSIAQRYCLNKFSENYEVTIGGVYHRKVVNTKNGTNLTLHLWDTGGEERFRAMAPLYYRDANAAVLVYDVKDYKSFESLNFWLKELDSKVKSEGLVLALAGNKCDVDESDRKTSALTDEGIKPLFAEISEEYIKRQLRKQNNN